MFFDSGQHLRVLYSKVFPCKRRAKPRVQQHRVISLHRRDRKSARPRFLNQPLRRIQAREIVEHSGNACLVRIDAVTPREQLGAPGHAQAVPVAMRLTEMLANAARHCGEACTGKRHCSTRPRRMRKRLR